jgi:GntR family transcriptional regulator
MICCHTVRTEGAGESPRNMFLHIDYNSPEPICRQAVAQIKLRVVSGSLKPGDQLPSIRDLSKELHINPTTVSRIYNELAHQGVVTLRQGQGVFIAETAPRLAPEEVLRKVAEHARAMLVEGLRQGLEIREIKKIVEEEHRKIKGDQG